VHERDETRGDEDGPGDVEGGPEGGARLVHDRDRERHRGDDHGDVDEEDPAPAEGVDQDAPREAAGGAAQPADRGPRPEGPGARRALGERRREDGE